MDFARLDHEVDLVIGHERTKTLGYAFQLKLHRSDFFQLGLLNLTQEKGSRLSPGPPILSKLLVVDRGDLDSARDNLGL